MVAKAIEQSQAILASAAAAPDTPEGVEGEKTLEQATVDELIERLMVKALDAETAQQCFENQTKVNEYRDKALHKRARLEADGRMHRIHVLGRDLPIHPMLWKQETLSNRVKCDPTNERWEELNEGDLEATPLNLDEFTTDGVLRFLQQNRRLTQIDDLSETSKVCFTLQTFDILSGASSHWNMPTGHLMHNIVKVQMPGPKITGKR